MTLVRSGCWIGHRRARSNRMIRPFRPTPPERSWMRTGCGAAADRAGPPIPDAVENTPEGRDPRVCPGCEVLRFARLSETRALARRRRLVGSRGHVLTDRTDCPHAAPAYFPRVGSSRSGTFTRRKTGVSRGQRRRSPLRHRHGSLRKRTPSSLRTGLTPRGSHGMGRLMGRRQRSGRTTLNQLDRHLRPARA